MVSSSPVAAEQHLLVGHQPAQPHASAPVRRPRGPRARRRGRRWSRPARHRARPPAGRRRSGRRCAPPCRRGRRPCPGGAARPPRPTRRTGPPAAANDIIRIAPMAKLGAIRTPTPGCAATWPRSASTPVVVPAGGADDDVDAPARRSGRRWPARRPARRTRPPRRRRRGRRGRRRGRSAPPASSPSAASTAAAHLRRPSARTHRSRPP